ncbi:hypothetical protein PV327_004566 [Microctonus hyperodae]|uniref:Uncharacterized protein n=1 Tax=Microctonus hyperodae TaxID=165561 RepID=A0AA39FCP6_MICHY|nr:hypothetical protein PV327_004566 [Microctonus hyperodae]
MLKLLCSIILLFIVTETVAKPTIYKRNEDNIFEPVMVPVSSTVIPLPVYKVGYGYGFVSKDKKAQATYNPDGQVKLITAKKRVEKI